MIYTFDKTTLFLYLEEDEYKPVITYYYTYFKDKSGYSELAKMSATKEMIYNECLSLYAKQCKYPNLYPMVNELSALDELLKKVKSSPAPSVKPSTNAPYTKAKKKKELILTAAIFVASIFLVLFKACIFPLFENTAFGQNELADTIFSLLAVAGIWGAIFGVIAFIVVLRSKTTDK